MGFFDFLSGKDDAERAAEANRASANLAFGQQQGIANAYSGNALGAIGTGLSSAIGSLGSGRDAYNAYLGKATDAANAGIAAYTPLSDLGKKYGAATTAALAALGVGGPSGFDASAFRNTPGYQFQVDEATRAAGNKAASLGIAGSGNTLYDVANRSQKIADTTFNQNYLTPLLSFVNPELAAVGGAASGVATGNRTLADLYTGAGTANQASYGTQAGLQYGAGSDTANVYGNVAGIQSQASKDLAAGNIAANNLVAQAGQKDADFWGGLIKGGVTALGTFAGGPGGGVLANKLFPA